jgi:hypothetical protein
MRIIKYTEPEKMLRMTAEVDACTAEDAGRKPGASEGYTNRLKRRGVLEGAPLVFWR